MNVRKYQEDCFVMCVIPLLRVVSSTWTRMDVNLRTGGDNNKKKFVNSMTFFKLNEFL